jgi:hypothetical protein
MTEPKTLDDWLEKYTTPTLKSATYVLNFPARHYLIRPSYSSRASNVQVILYALETLKGKLNNDINTARRELMAIDKDEVTEND